MRQNTKSSESGHSSRKDSRDDRDIDIRSNRLYSRDDWNYKKTEKENKLRNVQREAYRNVFFKTRFATTCYFAAVEIVE